MGLGRRFLEARWPSGENHYATSQMIESAINEIRHHVGIFTGFRLAGLNPDEATGRFIQYLKNLPRRSDVVRNLIENQLDVLRFGLEKEENSIYEDYIQDNRLLERSYQKFLEE